MATKKKRKPAPEPPEPLETGNRVDVAYALRAARRLLNALDRLTLLARPRHRPAIM